jgi:mono/diheme cytochrome c family protein
MSNHTRSARFLPAPLVFLVACSGPATNVPAGEQTGALLYETQSCGTCHGADGASAFWRPGPDLLPNLDTWTVDSLAAYLADPISIAQGIERLGEGSMPEYGHLDEATRRRLAEYVLSLGSP